MTIDFGTDVCLFPDTDDADANWSEVSGIALVRQDMRIRLQTDSLPYSGADLDAGLELALESADWGFDLRRLLGATAGTAASHQARIKRVVLKDQRIKSADVVVTEGTTLTGLRSLTVTVDAKTALGPFRLVFQLDASVPDQVKIIEGQ